MGVRGTGVRRTRNHGATRLIIDFQYVDREGVRRRFRKFADVQTMTAARAEADRLRALAAKTGTLELEQEKLCPTFAEFVVTRWRPVWAQRYKPSTLGRYEDLLDQGVREAFGHRRLDKIGAVQVEEYAAGLLARGVQAWPHTSLVSSILRAAVALGDLREMPRLPCHKRKHKRLPDCPDTDEVTITIKLARGWLRIAVALAVYAGLRSGELRAIEVRDVDLKRDFIIVRRAMSGNQVLGTKDDEDRIVPIDPQLRPILVEAVEGKEPTSRIVLTARGTTPRRQSVLDKLKRLQDRHGLRHRSVHSLRHAFCTQLLRLGADPEVVRTMAGHSDLETTMLYLHARVEDARRAMERGAAAEGQ